jgi:hypothetical protein
MRDGRRFPFRSAPAWLPPCRLWPRTPSLIGVTMAPVGLVPFAPGRWQSISPGGSMSRDEQDRNRPLVVHVRFEPNRLAGDSLAAAYEQLAPVRRRIVRPVPGTLDRQDAARATQGEAAC